MDSTPSRATHTNADVIELSPLLSSLGFTSGNQPSLLVPVTEQQKLQIRQALGPGPPSEVLVKSVRGKNSSGAMLFDTVNRENMQTLKPGEWLSDPVVNHFFKHALKGIDQLLCSNDSSRRASLFFSSFFLQKAFDEQSAKASRRGKFRYNLISKWIKEGIDLFEMEHLFFPYNYNQAHWGLAVVFVQQRCINWYDSLGWVKEGRMEGLLELMEYEWVGLGYEDEYGDFNSSDWKLQVVDVPRQIGGTSRVLHFSIDISFSHNCRSVCLQMMTVVYTSACLHTSYCTDILSTLTRSSSTSVVTEFVLRYLMDQPHRL